MPATEASTAPSHIQPGAAQHVLAFNKRYHTLKKEGINYEDIFVIMLGELSYNLAEGMKQAAQNK